MADYTPQTPALAGTLVVANAAAGGGDRVLNTKGDVIMRIINGAGAPITLTIAAVQTNRPADGVFPAQTLASQVITVANGTSKIVGPFPPAFNDANGYLGLAWSSPTSVTFEAYRPNAL